MKDKIYAVLFWLFIIFTWQMLSYFNMLPQFLFPSLAEIVLSFTNEFDTLMSNLKHTFFISFFSLLIAIILAVFLSYFMYKIKFLYNIVYPILLFTQNTPSIALAPLLILYLGYGLAPKIVLIVLSTLFPILINLLQAYKNSDIDYIIYLKSLKASKYQILKHYLFSHSLPYFFAALKISVSYAYLSAISAEWLGGFKGLGVLLIQYKKLFDYSAMYVVIILISLLSMLSIYLITLLEKKVIKWKR